MEVTFRKILFVEDDTELLAQMVNWFRSKNNTVWTATSVRGAKAVLEHHLPDIIILDIILPDGTGLDILKNLVSLPPVIVLSDLGSEENLLDGFNAGATDYVVKPCSMRLLETRMSLRLHPSPNSVLQYENLKIDSHKRKVFYKDTPVAFMSSEFNILWFLMNNPNKFFSADEIYEQVWAAPSLQTTTIRRHLSTLRRKLQEISNSNLIVTEFGKGYSFLGDPFL